MDFHQTWYVHWYCGDLGWDCWWANFINFWQSYLPMTQLYFHFLTVNLVINRFLPNLVCALILWSSALGLLLGKFHQFLTVICLQNISIYFLENNLSKFLWIFTKFDMCIDSVEIWFGIAHWQIASIFGRVTCEWHDNGGYYLYMFLFNLKYSCCFLSFLAHLSQRLLRWTYSIARLWSLSSSTLLTSWFILVIFWGSKLWLPWQQKAPID